MISEKCVFLKIKNYYLFKKKKKKLILSPSYLCYQLYGITSSFFCWLYHFFKSDSHFPDHLLTD